MERTIRYIISDGSLDVYIFPLPRYKFKWMAKLLCAYMNLFFKENKYHVVEIKSDWSPTPEELLQSFYNFKIYTNSK